MQCVKAWFRELPGHLQPKPQDAFKGIAKVRANLLRNELRAHFADKIKEGAVQPGLLRLRDEGGELEAVKFGLINFTNAPYIDAYVELMCDYELVPEEVRAKATAARLHAICCVRGAGRRRAQPCSRGCRVRRHAHSSSLTNKHAQHKFKYSRLEAAFMKAASPMRLIKRMGEQFDPKFIPFCNGRSAVDTLVVAMILIRETPQMMGAATCVVSAARNWTPKEASRCAFRRRRLAG